MSLPTDERRCTHFTSKGRRCANPRLRDSLWCFSHSKHPGQLIARGETFKNRNRLDTAEGIHNFLAKTLRALADGEIAPGRASALAYVAQTMLASLARLREERIAVHTNQDWETIREAVLVDAAIDGELGLGEYAEMPPEEAARAAMADARAAMENPQSAVEKPEADSASNPSAEEVSAA